MAICSSSSVVVMKYAVHVPGRQVGHGGWYVPVAPAAETNLPGRIASGCEYSNYRALAIRKT